MAELMTKLMKKERKPYTWGTKIYLASMEVGETLEDNGLFNWRGMQVTASRLKYEYGGAWKFTTTKKGRQVTRIR